jgi:HSP20 family protein
MAWYPFTLGLDVPRGLGPWRELSRLHREMNRVFEGYDRPAATEFPPVNVWSGERGLRVHSWLPGFEKDDIDVSVVGDTLTLRGSRAENSLKEGETYHRQERGSGKFVRTFQLPFQVEADAVKASFRNGVLEIELPRAAAEQPRKIAVTTA